MSSRQPIVEMSESEEQGEFTYAFPGVREFYKALEGIEKPEGGEEDLTSNTENILIPEVEMPEIPDITMSASEEVDLLG